MIHLQSRYSEDVIEIGGKEITVYRIKNDVYGNPRYVVHYLDIADNYDEALKKAKEAGGKKYRGREFGSGMFVFQSYNIRDTLRRALR